MQLDDTIIHQILIFQRNEITEHHIYQRLAKSLKSPQNQDVMEKIAVDELRHYHDWKAYTKQEVKPEYLRLHLRDQINGARRGKRSD